jgi:hypothetical protein
MYIQEDVGIAEWGINHAWDPWKDDRRWRDGVPYRFAQWPSMTGQVLAAELMGLKNLWNHPAIFAYSERHTVKEGLGDGVEGQMWNAYKTQVSKVLPVTITPNGGNVTTAQTVSLNTETSGSQIYYTTNGMVPTQSSQPYTGPISVNSTLTLKAVAFKTDMQQSDTSSATFTFPATEYIVQPPIITSPTTDGIQYSSRTEYVKLSWNDTPLTKYNIRVEEYLDSSKTTKTVSPERRYWENSDNPYFGWKGYVFINDYSKRAIYIPVEPGRYYTATVIGFNQNTPTIYGEPDGPSAASVLNFSIASSSDITPTNPTTYTLTTTTSGAGTGTITGNTNTYTNGTTATLTATPTTGSTFTGWSGACSGTGSCQVSMTSNKSVTANFSLIPPTTPTLGDSDSDGIPDTIDKCPTTPTSLISVVNTYGCPKPLLTKVKVLNNLNTEDITNISNLEIEDIASIYGKVKFNQPINIFGTTSTSVQINLDTYIQFADKKVTVSSSSQFNKPATITLYNVTLTKPLIKKNGLSTKSSYTYDKVARTLTFNVDGFSTYEIVEETTADLETFTLTASKSGTGMGVINGIDAATTVLPTGSSLTLSVTPNAGSVFIGWSGDCSGTGSCVINLTSNKSVNAIFNTNTSGTSGGFSGPSYGNSSSNSSNSSNTTNPGAYINPNNIGLGVKPTTNTTNNNNSYTFKTDLKLFTRHPEVIELQKFLNSKGYTVSIKGAGSKGLESTYFGPATRSALIRFQIKNNIKPAQGFFGKITKGLINSGRGM